MRLAGIFKSRSVQCELLAVDTLVLVRVLWFPVDEDPGATPWWMRWAFFNHVPGGHYLLNVMLLVPTAALVALIWPHMRWLRVAALCLAISCVAELGQFLVPTRVPDLLDVLTNSAGAAVVAWGMRRRRDR